jgi:Galactose oxidase, central domain
MRVARSGHTATLLRDGRVLAVGGETANREMLDSTELFDPVTEQWSDGPRMATPRANHIASLLPTGQILIAGGGPSTPTSQALGGDVSAAAMIFDPTSNELVSVSSMHFARSHFGAVTLTNGRVLIVGGAGAEQVNVSNCGAAPYCGPYGKPLSKTELFEPETRSFSLAGDLTAPRLAFSVTAFAAPERVMVAGGWNPEASPLGLRSTESYDASTRLWTPWAQLPGPGREHHGAARLGSDRIVVAGGKEPNVSPLHTSVLLSNQGTAMEGPNFSAPRTTPGIVTLQSGDVLVVGGFNQRAKSGQTVLRESTILSTEATWTKIGDLNAGRLLHTTTLLSDGRVLVCGGIDELGTLKTCELTD